MNNVCCIACKNLDVCETEYGADRPPCASESVELAATDSQQTQAKMPSLQEYMQFALSSDVGFRSHNEIYSYFARHFGCA